MVWDFRWTIELGSEFGCLPLCLLFVSNAASSPSSKPRAFRLKSAYECRFEGMKAYKGEDGAVRLFRPDMNMKRMNRVSSASTIPLPWFALSGRR